MTVTHLLHDVIAWPIYCNFICQFGLHIFMANSAPAIHWICVGSAQVYAAGVSLEGAQEAEGHSSTRTWKTGDVNIAVVECPSLEPLRKGDTWTQLRDATRAGTRIDGVIITAVKAEGQRVSREPHAAPGDVVISPLLEGDGSAISTILKHARQVLRAEAGEDGSWLSPTTDESSGPRLHYVDDVEHQLWEDIAPCTLLLSAR